MQNEPPLQPSTVSWTPSCTNVGGLLVTTIQGLERFHTEYGNGLLVTGGSEQDSHSDVGGCSHVEGCKVDLIDSGGGVTNVEAYIINSFTFLDPSLTACLNSLGSNYGTPLAQGGPCFTFESGSRPHVDIGFPTDSATPVGVLLTGIGLGSVTSSVGGINCGLGGTVCVTSVTRGITVPFTAAPDSMSVFAGWQYVDKDFGNVGVISANGARSVYAQFDPLPPPPPGNPGCWVAAPIGWFWNCPTQPPPLGGTPPSQGCWHWDATAGTTGGWVYDVCGGDPTRRDPNPPVSGGGIILEAGDPNDKQGAQGAGPAHYLAGSELLRYSLLFQNVPTASAPASTVVITDAFNLSAVDVTTLKLGPVSFGTHVFTPPPVELASIGTYTTNLDLRPTENLGLQLSASLNISSGVLTWTLTTLDPTTAMPPTDPTVGFLAPGEEGSVLFSVAPVAGTATNTQIANQATIVFNANAPMNTPVWSNTTDGTSPTSAVMTLSSIEPPTGFMVTWSGTDVGSGIRDFTIYLSDNGGPFTPWLTNTAATSGIFAGQLSHSYGFYSIARDLVGNVEPAKSAPEATTQVNAVVTDATPPVTSASFTPAPNTAGWNNGPVTVSLSSADNAGGSGVKQLTYSTSGAQTTAGTTLAGAPPCQHL